MHPANVKKAGRPRRFQRAGRAAAALAAACVLCLSAAGCAAGARPAEESSAPKADPAALWQEMEASMADITDLDASFSYDITTELDGSSIATSLSGGLQLKDMEQNPEFRLDLSLGSMGQSFSMGMYYADGTAYLDQNGIRFQYPLPKEDILTSFGSLGGDAASLEAPENLDEIARYWEENLLGSAAVSEQDGKTRLAFEITGQQLAEMAEFFSGPDGTQPSAGDDAGEDPLGISPDLSQLGSLKVAFTLNAARYMEKLEIDLAGGVPLGEAEGAGGQAAAVSGKLTFQLNNPGQPVTVTPPEGLDEYQKLEEYASSNPFLEETAGRKPFEGLAASDIASATVTLEPPYKRLQVPDNEELLGYLKDVVIYNVDNSYTEYFGQGIPFTLTMADGSQKKVGAYNPFLILDGVGFRTEYAPCVALSNYANRLLDAEDAVVLDEWDLWS